MLYPEWDIQYLALPKGKWEERKQILESILVVESKLRDLFDK